MYGITLDKLTKQFNGFVAVKTTSGYARLRGAILYACGINGGACSSGVVREEEEVKGLNL